MSQMVLSQAQSESAFDYFVSPSWTLRLGSNLSLWFLGLSRMLIFFSLLEALSSFHLVQVAQGEGKREQEKGKRKYMQTRHKADL